MNLPPGARPLNQPQAVGQPEHECRGIAQVMAQLRGTGSTSWRRPPCKTPRRP
jgi:hypothetical protein